MLSSKQNFRGGSDDTWTRPSSPALMSSLHADSLSRLFNGRTRHTTRMLSLFRAPPSPGSASKIDGRGSVEAMLAREELATDRDESLLARAAADAAILRLWESPTGGNRVSVVATTAIREVHERHSRFLSQRTDGATCDHGGQWRPLGYGACGRGSGLQARRLGEQGRRWRLHSHHRNVRLALPTGPRGCPNSYCLQCLCDRGRGLGCPPRRGFQAGRFCRGFRPVGSGL
jgi:hypothetical protein